MQKKVEGSLTVEGAMVMGITLMMIGFLLIGIFDIEERVVERMLLAEALERTVCCEDGLSEEVGITSEKIAESCERKLRTCFRCGNASLSVNPGTFRIEGMSSGKTETRMSVRKSNPEKSLRMLTAVREQAEASGKGAGP